MTHQVLARKWRPRRFTEVIGQDHVVKALTNALDTGRIHHAYLFTGTRGVGKTTLARILAKALNCRGADGQGGMTSSPCGVCPACQDIDSGRFVDLLEVDAATNTKVDEMRELLETAQYMPVSGRYKVYIIDEVHMLSRSAFNAMLKTLEEPPGHVQFILATTDPQKLPVTVLSRCIQFNLKQLPATLIATHLANVLREERVAAEEKALLAIGHAAQGSVRDSLSLLDQAIAYGAGTVTAQGVSSMLGALDESALIRVLERVAERDAKGLLAEVEAMSARSYSFEAALRDLASLLQRIALTQAAGLDLDLAATNLAKHFSAEQLQVCYQVALTGRRDLYLAPDEQAGMTMTLLRMLSLMGGSANIRVRVESAVSAPTSTPLASQAAAVAEPAVSIAQSTAVTQSAFDGDWLGLVRRVNLPSLAGMLARQCEFLSLENQILRLALPATQKHLMEKSYQDKLRDALEPHLGKGLRVVIDVADALGQSVAATEAREEDDRQRRAELSITQDAFVKDLVADFGAELNTASIRPLQ